MTLGPENRPMRVWESQNKNFGTETSPEAQSNYVLLDTTNEPYIVFYFKITSSFFNKKSVSYHFISIISLVVQLCQKAAVHGRLSLTSMFKDISRSLSLLSTEN